MATLYTTLPRRPVAAGVGAAATAMVLLGAACGSREPARPNVLLVVISGMRPDHSSSYGYRKATTPALDALAAGGTLFENAFTPVPWGPSAQASIATGLYLSEHGVDFDNPVLGPSFETVAEKLKAAGYATVMVSTDSAVGAAGGFGQGFDSFTEIHPEEEASPDDGAASAETALTMWLRQSWEPQKEKSPFFAVVLMTNPRLPFNPPGEYRDRFLDKPVPLPRLEQLTQLWVPFARQFVVGAANLAPDEMTALAALYDGEIAYADYRLGRIVEMLKSAKLLDGTLVIVTSDSGEDLGDHGLLADVSRVYDSIARVPLVMRLPRRVPAGKRVDDQVQTVDIGRTILALTAPAAPGAKLPETAEAPLLQSRPAAIIEARFDPGAILYYRSLMPGADLSVYEMNMLAVRTSEVKYIVTSRQTGALFDLKADPGEHKSVLAEQSAKVPGLQAKLAAWAAVLSRPGGGAGQGGARQAPAASTASPGPATAPGAAPVR